MMKRDHLNVYNYDVNGEDVVRRGSWVKDQNPTFLMLVITIRGKRNAICCEMCFSLPKNAIAQFSGNLVQIVANKFRCVLFEWKYRNVTEHNKNYVFLFKYY